MTKKDLKLHLWSPRADTGFPGYLRDLYRLLKWLLGQYRVLQTCYGFGDAAGIWLETQFRYLKGSGKSLFIYLFYLVSHHVSYYLRLVHQIFEDKVNSPPSRATYSRHLHLADLHQILGHVRPRTSTSLTQ